MSQDFHWLDFDQPFSIPSLFSAGVNIESRVSYGKSTRGRTCFVFCHPYGPMGGDLNSNVVVTLARYFSRQGYSTARFNMRGVGATGGETSRDGASEEGDLRSVVGTLGKEGGVDGWGRVDKFILVGYSYGAMISGSAAHTLPTLLPHLSDPLLAWVSISYPYAALSSITLYQGFLVLENAKKIAAQKLLIIGSDDQFTPVAEHRKFADSLQDPKKVVEVDGVGHFWQGGEEDLVALIVEWLKCNVRGMEDCDKALPETGRQGEGPRL